MIDGDETLLRVILLEVLKFSEVAFLLTLPLSPLSQDEKKERKKEGVKRSFIFPFFSLSFSRASSGDSTGT